LRDRPAEFRGFELASRVQGDEARITMDHPTYTLRPIAAAPGAYRKAVAALADLVLAQGEPLRSLLDAYGRFVETAGREARRSHEEYLLEALMVGVLWRARGHEATVAVPKREQLVEALVDERRAGCGRRRDGSTAALLVLDAPFTPGRSDPSIADFQRLFAWLLASGEYDDELGRLAGWQDFFAAHPAWAAVLLRALVAFAVQFETASERALGVFTARVDRFLRHTLPLRGQREDTVQCSRRRVEYHFNMVGAEILNRAWREDFLACDHHVVVLPGCARRRADAECRASRSDTELRCTGCTESCTVSAATEVAARAGAEALAVLHGSDFGRLLRSPALAGGNVAIIGVACVPGLVGAGWRARAQGLPAQCVLLESSGCSHWREAAVPTALDLGELARILTNSESAAMTQAVQ
jgi:hypothetical protein